MPANFRYAGLIRMALPQAQIIHTVRDPVNTPLLLRHPFRAAAV